MRSPARLHYSMRKSVENVERRPLAISEMWGWLTHFSLPDAEALGADTASYRRAAAGRSGTSPARSATTSAPSRTTVAFWLSAPDRTPATAAPSAS